MELVPKSGMPVLGLQLQSGWVLVVEFEGAVVVEFEGPLPVPLGSDVVLLFEPGVSGLVLLPESDLSGGVLPVAGVVLLPELDVSGEVPPVSGEVLLPRFGGSLDGSGGTS